MHCVYLHIRICHMQKKYNLRMVMGVLHVMLLAAYLQMTEKGEVEIKLHTVKTAGRVEV